MRTQKYQSRFIEMFCNGNWEQKPLGKVGTFKRGGGFQKSDFVEHGIPCIHYGQIHTVFGPFIFSHISEISSDLESKTKFASKGDLIIAITSEDAEGSCKSTAWLGAYPVAVGAHATIYNHCMNPLYMSFFFKSALFNHGKMEYIHGTNVVEIRPDDIAKILVPCPPLSLQEQFSTIAEQADKSKFNGFKSRFIEMFGAPNSNPLGIPTGLVSDIFTLQMGKTPARDTARYWAKDGSGNKWISIADMSQYEYFTEDTEEYISDSAVKETGMKLIPEQTVIMSFKLTIGRVSVTSEPIFSNEAIVAFIPRVHVYNTRFLYYLVKFYDWLENAALAVKGKTLNKESIGKNRLIIPSIESQNEFASFAEQADKSKYLS